MSEFMKGGIKIRTMNDAYNDIKDASRHDIKDDQFLA